MFLDPVGAELAAYPDLYLEFGRWMTEDSSVVITIDLFFDCARSPGLIEPTADGGLIWRSGGPPAGVGIEVGGEDCDVRITDFPEIFDHQPSGTRGVDLELEFDMQKVQLTVGDFSQEFEAT